MFHVTKMADYAVMLLCEFASADAQRLSARDVAARCGLGEPTAMKLLKLLAKAGILDSVRGASGGYSLQRAPEDISICDAIAAIDGPLAVTDCAGVEENSCEYKTQCRSQFGWQSVNAHINAYLMSVTIADFMATCPAENAGCSASV